MKSFTMKKKFILLFSLIITIAIITITISSCTATKDPNVLKVSNSSDKLVGENYQTVTSELKTTGFTNIKTMVLNDLITGWITKDGEVKQIDINGKTEFDSGTTFPKDSKIVITYHTFPKAEKSVAKAVDKPVGKPVDKPSVVPPVESTEEILTAKNNKDLANLLALKNENDPSIGVFAKKYVGKTIEFDGNIANVAHFTKYKTLYDLLVYVGNYSKAFGPSFRFENVNMYDMNFTGSEIPNDMKEGQNIHIIAKVVRYNQVQGLFFLEPVSTKLR
ncbi:DUF4839 domain-containing protein [Clostridium estertheticum]|uniref:DUF4839 domain-containing protein n=1 Tax=Clostridium estertheticum TaxID=238834 RepID=UPI001CF2BB57|nr:DUF4839 domain-containing protein [Clostridium estertheticum]MCB2353914.1 DUF4839 domain-containing protein [Clostridium estertheticum]WAG43055.1 DUF4839 domain-containing protein [Clostridium estertheticum]